jgi:hypothetical protein
MCRHTIAGSAAAAERIGYPHVAALIMEEEMGPEQIARLFTLSASKQAGRHAALIILAGSISRHRAEPEGWSGDAERKLAREGLAREQGYVVLLLPEFNLEVLLNKIAAEAALLTCSKREPLSADA